MTIKEITTWLNSNPAALEMIVWILFFWCILTFIRCLIAGWSAHKYNTWYLSRAWICNPTHWWMWMPWQHAWWFEKHCDLNGDWRK